MHPTHKLVDPSKPAGTLNYCSVCKSGPRLDTFDQPCVGQAPAKPAQPTKAERFANILAKMAEHAKEHQIVLNAQSLREITFYALALGKVDYETFNTALYYVILTSENAGA